MLRNTILYFSCLLFLGFKAFPQHPNILVGEQYSIEEPSIMINPSNPNEIVAGTNPNYVFYSSDGGLSWTPKILTSTNGVWGDPCIIVDNSGNFYYFHLSNPDAGNWIDRIVCQKSSNAGLTWSNGSFTGLNGKKVQDKEWATIDRENGNIYVSWTQFDVYGNLETPKPGDSTNILFSRSEDGGNTWSAATKINAVAGDCYDDDNAVEGAVPTVGPNGEVYICWAGPLGLLFDKSDDFGHSWLKNDIKVTDIPGGWNYNVPGIYRCNGLPVIGCDTSNSPNRGNIYINWSDQRNGKDNTDIWLSRSIDGGLNWSEPLKVNNDSSSHHQFFTWLTIDQSNGYIYFVFYDRRHHKDNKTDVYMAVSKDGGLSFENFKISKSSFNPFSTVFFGDYTNISAHNGIIRPIWTRLDTSKLSVWTAIIDTSKMFDLIEEGQEFDLSAITYPNPFIESCWFSFKLNTSAHVFLEVLDLQGKSIETILQGNELVAGKYTCKFSPQNNINQGIYYFKLVTENKTSIRKIIYTD